MIGYESQCRLLLRAFPLGFREQRGEDLIAALVDDAPRGARTVPVRTGADLLVSGARTRVFRAGAATSWRAGAVEGLALAAVIGLGLEAAICVASAVYKAEHGIVFYLPTDQVRYLGQGAFGADSLTTWVALAVVSSLAFLACLQGAWRLAAAGSTAVAAYLITTATYLANAVPPIGSMTVISGTGSTPASLGWPPPVPARYMEFSATPGFVAIAAIAAILAVVVALRSSRRSYGERSLWWGAPAMVLAVALSVTGDGNAAQGPASNLMTAYPPQGGIMTAMQALLVVAVVIGIFWSRIDPRPGWAIAVLMIPFIVHQISDFTIGRFYYGYLYQPGWQTALPLAMGGVGMLALIGSAANSAARLRRR